MLLSCHLVKSCVGTCKPSAHINAGQRLASVLNGVYARAGRACEPAVEDEFRGSRVPASAAAAQKVICLSRIEMYRLVQWPYYTAKALTLQYSGKMKGSTYACKSVQGKHTEVSAAARAHQALMYNMAC